MSAQAGALGPVLRALRIAVIGALVAALAYQAIGAALFLPRFGSEDPREVVEAYYQAQRWGYRTIAERGLSDEVRESYHDPNVVRGLTDDAFLSRDLKISGPADIGLHGEYAEEVQFVVEYDSVWNVNTLGPPGGRHWFVYLGRNAGGPWQVLGQGTGP